MSKRQTKAKFAAGTIFLGEALECLMFDHGMDRGDALRYLGL